MITMTKDEEFAEKLSALGNRPVSYEDYAPLVEKFREFYHETRKVGGTMPWDITLTADQIRLIYLSLTTTKAQLKKYDPKKGLNQ